MTRQESFEKHWAETHDVPVETMAQYRWKDQDGYRLPGMASHYRTFCAALDSVVISLPEAERDTDGMHSQYDTEVMRRETHNEVLFECRKSIEQAGVTWK